MNIPVIRLMVGLLLCGIPLVAFFRVMGWEGTKFILVTAIGAVMFLVGLSMLVHGGH